MADYIQDRYFGWMVSMLGKGARSYSKLLSRLSVETFRYSNPMDRNRYQDGIALRGRFASEMNLPDDIIDENFENVPCSMLEMMLALSLRCEEQIMWNPGEDNNAASLFWKMIENLGLFDMRDTVYDNNFVSYVLDRLAANEYGSDGTGGLFYIGNIGQDARQMEIWYQMCAYLNEFV